jgi:hypothetical protein
VPDFTFDPEFNQYFKGKEAATKQFILNDGNAVPEGTTGSNKAKGPVEALFSESSTPNLIIDANKGDHIDPSQGNSPSVQEDPKIPHLQKRNPGPGGHMFQSQGSAGLPNASKFPQFHSNHLPPRPGGRPGAYSSAPEQYRQKQQFSIDPQLQMNVENPPGVPPMYQQEVPPIPQFQHDMNSMPQFQHQMHPGQDPMDPYQQSEYFWSPNFQQEKDPLDKRRQSGPHPDGHSHSSAPIESGDAAMAQSQDAMPPSSMQGGSPMKIVTNPYASHVLQQKEMERIVSSYQIREFATSDSSDESSSERSEESTEYSVSWAGTGPEIFVDPPESPAPGM